MRDKDKEKQGIREREKKNVRGKRRESLSFLDSGEMLKSHFLREFHTWGLITVTGGVEWFLMQGFKKNIYFSVYLCAWCLI